MKKLTLLLTVLVMAFSAQANMLRLNADNYRQFRSHQVVNPAISQSQALELQAQQLNQPSRVITSKPEGELRTYERTGGQAIFPDMDKLGLDLQSGKIDMVFADNNVVYFKNILFNCSSAYGTSWVEGTLSEDGTTITVPMGQSIGWSDYY